MEERKKSSKKKRNKVKASSPNEILITKELNDLKALTIIELSNKLFISDSFISSLLEQNGINKITFHYHKMNLSKFKALLNLDYSL